MLSILTPLIFNIYIYIYILFIIYIITNNKILFFINFNFKIKMVNSFYLEFFKIQILKIIFFSQNKILLIEEGIKILFYRLIFFI